MGIWLAVVPELVFIGKSKRLISPSESLTQAWSGRGVQFATSVSPSCCWKNLQSRQPSVPGNGMKFVNG